MTPEQRETAKLRQITGDDRHQVEFLDDCCDVCGCWPCAHTDPEEWEWRNLTPAPEAAR